MPTLPDSIPALVLGAGPAGLAAAAELQRAGLTTIVLDKADEVGSSWAKHYDRLHLHTARTLSALPGRGIPRRYGRWVARDDFRTYLREYATANALDVRLGVTATSVEQLADGTWSVGWRGGDSTGTVAASILVVATGYNHTAFLPEWEGRSGYRGRVIHSSQYRNPADLGAASVLVVGSGNSGSEIAADLAAAGVTVQLAVRTPPNIVRRSVLGIPSQALVLSISPLPDAAGDAVSALLQKLTVGDLSRYGLTRATRGIITQAARDDLIPTIDVGLIDAVKAGTVEIVPAVDVLTEDGVRLIDGRTVTPDAVIVATGFRRGLEELVGGLDVLEPSGRPSVNAAEQAPGRDGLYFIGYSNPLTGNLRQLAIDAKRIGRHAKHRAVSPA